MYLVNFVLFIQCMVTIKCKLYQQMHCYWLICSYVTILCSNMFQPLLGSSSGTHLKVKITNRMTITVFLTQWHNLVTVTITASCTVRGPTADSSRHLSTEDESKGTFSLNCISASNSVTDYYPWRWSSRVKTCRSFLRIKIYIFWCISWWILFLYDIVHGHGTH
jgi:hypothetical protein